MDSNSYILQNGNNNDSEINLSKIFDFFKRNRKIISIFTLTGILLGGYYSFTKEKIWQGEFQIVIDNGRNNMQGMFQGVSQKQLDIISLPLNINKSNDLQTEIGILKSPSVLLNVFNFVKVKKGEKNNIDKLRFRDWKNKSLKIELEKGTNILNIAFKDNDKGIIVPVLKNISNAYQNYSGKKRRRDIELTESFLKNQISIYKEQSKKSFSEVQRFAIREDLLAIDNSNSAKENNSSGVSRSITNTETKRATAANELRMIQENLKIINDKSLNLEELLYYPYLFKTTEFDSLINKINLLENKIVNREIIYLDDDEITNNLKAIKKSYLKSLRSQIINFLNSKKNNAKAIIKASERSEDVLIKFRELQSNALKDQSILENLTKQYRSTLLEKARSNDPWELITKPTILPDPVSPIKRYIIFTGMILGLFLGLLFCLIKENNDDFIFYEDDLKEFKNLSILGKYSSSDIENNELFEILIRNKLKEIKGNISFLAINNSEVLQNKIANNEELNPSFNFTNEFTKSIESDYIIILIFIGKTKNKDLRDILNKIVKYNKTLVGTLLFFEKD